nr:MAG TPA: putative tail component [Caudoviricetes sp.]
MNSTSGLTSSDKSTLVEVQENNAEQIEAAMDKAIAKALTMIGLKAEGNAKAICPVDTGRLRNSITNAIDTEANAVYVGTNVEYAPDIELGTTRMHPHPYLRPAAADHADEYRAILKGCLESA